MESVETQELLDNLKLFWNKFLGKEDIDGKVTPALEASEIQKVCNLIYQENKFENTNIDIFPEVIILDNFEYVFNKNNLNIEGYCVAYNSKKFKVLVSKKLDISC